MTPDPDPDTGTAADVALAEITAQMKRVRVQMDALRAAMRSADRQVAVDTLSRRDIVRAMADDILFREDNA